MAPVKGSITLPHQELSDQQLRRRMSADKLLSILLNKSDLQMSDFFKDNTMPMNGCSAKTLSNVHWIVIWHRCKIDEL